MERICLDCSAYLPTSAGEPTEFGICLNDEAFEPFIEELMEGLNFDSCRDLVERKKFVGDRPACPDFDESEVIEIDDDSPFGQLIARLAESGKLTSQALREALLEEQIDRIDFKSIPVDSYARGLQSANLQEREDAISSLGGLTSMGNRAAFETLLGHLVSLPAPATIDEVHYKREILRHLSYGPVRVEVAPYLLDELQATRSNNTTRQWISDIFEFLEYCPWKVIREPLERMLEDNRFSRRFKEKVEDTLFRSRIRSEASDR